MSIQEVLDVSHESQVAISKQVSFSTLINEGVNDDGQFMFTGTGMEDFEKWEVTADYIQTMHTISFHCAYVKKR